jgi:hypothetical protein
MTAELVCPIHGPYDASLRTCPYCSNRRPPAPASLGGDETPTDIGYAQAVGRPGSGNVDDLPTDLGDGSSSARQAIDEESPTEIPASRRKGGRFLDVDDEEETQLGKQYRRGEDVTELDVVSTGLLGILWVKEGNRRGQIYKIKNGSVIGRKEGDLIIDDPKISSPHAKITIEEDQFIIWDFGSRNGTFVNGERIRAATPLKENDTVKMGDSIFVYKVLE